MAHRRRVTPQQVTRADHRKFCETEGWQPVLNARGKPTTHHITLELELPDGHILRTRISRPADQKHVYSDDLLGHLFKDQLQVTVDEFWACVSDGIKPDRDRQQPAPPPVGEHLPANLVLQLRKYLHVPLEEIATMTRQEATDRVREHWRQHGAQ